MPNAIKSYICANQTERPKKVCFLHFKGFPMKIKETISLILKNLKYPATIAGIIISLAIPFLIYLAGKPGVNKKEIVQQLDLSLPMPLFIVQTVAVIILCVLLHKDFREWIKGILPAKAFSIMAVVFAVAVAIFAGTQIEARHRVQSDESVFMSVAQNMFYNHESGTCNQGIFKDGNLECVSKSNSFKTKGLAYLYVLGMPLFGSSLHWIFNAELLMLPLAFLLMFLAIVAWTRQPLLAFFASLLMALQPTILFQFRAMSVEPLYIFLSALSFFVFKWAYDRNTIMHWALLALVLAFFAQTRQETVFCLLPFILFSLPRILDKKDFKASTFFVLLSVFTIPVLLTISYYQGFNFQGGEYSAHGHFFEDLAKNWEIMTKPLKDNGELENPFLTYFNYIFLFGVIYLAFRAIYDATKKNYFYLEILVFMLLYHIQTYMILENVSGDFSIEINQRYSLVMLPSMAFVAALPVAHAVQYFVSAANDSDKGEAKPQTIVIAALAVALIFTGWTFHYKEDFNKNIMYNRNHLTIEEHEIWNWLNQQPEKERFFIYGRPWHFVGYGVSSIHYDRARGMSNAEMQEIIKRYNGEVYYIRGLDCWDSQTYHKKAVEHRIPTTCDVFEREMDLQGVKNILITNNYWVQIAKFNGRKNYNPEKIIAISEPVITADSAQKTLEINYELKENNNTAANWNLDITVNNKSVKDSTYDFGSHKLTIPATSLEPGYNRIRFVVQDKTSGNKRADVSKFYFDNSTGAIPLTDLNPVSHKQGWGKLHINESIEGNKFNMDGQTFYNGIGTHAASETVYQLDKKYKTFRMLTALDDESLCNEGVSVEILGDGKSLAKTPVFQNGSIHTITVNISDIDKLTIKSTPIETINCAHVDIVNPVLIP